MFVVLRYHLLATSCLLAVTLKAPCDAQEQPSNATPAAAKLLPDTVVLFGEISNPADVVKDLLEHPLRPKLEALPAYQQALQSNDFLKLKAGLSLFEAGMGMRWPKVVAALTEGGAYGAFDAETEGAVALLKARDSETIALLRDTVLAAVKFGEDSGGQEDRVRTGSYRGIDAYAIDDNVRLAALDTWLLVTNKAELGKKIIDLHLDETRECLADEANFVEAVRGREQNSTGWGYANIQLIRDSGAAKELYSGRTDNALAELLFGGILTNLQHTPYATSSIDVSDDQFTWAVATPHSPDWIGENRQYYFGENGAAVALPLLELDRRLFALSSYRDMSQMWLRAGDLMTDKANDDLAKADTQLTTFFSGRDFGEDILGALEPDVQLVAVNQDFAGLLPRPAIRIPAFALQLRMTNPSETQPELRRVFQSFIGFLNVVGAMNGQPQFDLGTESTAEAQLYTATYVPSQEQREATDAPINFNFSPSIAFAGNRLIISSTSALASALIHQEDSSDASRPTGHNTEVMLDAGVLQQVLSENREQLVAQNMLEKGHSQEAAEGEIGLLIDLFQFVRGATATLDTFDQELKLTFQLTLSE